MTKIENVDPLDGLTHSTRKLIESWFEPGSIKEKARNAGFSESTVHSRLYKIIRNPKFVRALKMFYDCGKDQLKKDLANAYYVEMMTEPTTKENQKTKNFLYKTEMGETHHIDGHIVGGIVHLTGNDILRIIRERKERDDLSSPSGNNKA